jgi:D-proline reductase (dithiol) PrdB
METPRPIPWTPLKKSLDNCKVALLSSGGVALETDLPFDQEGERQNPWWGDPSFRKIPRGTQTRDIRVYHLHINPVFGEQDINCLLPVDRLDELVSSGEVGASALTHYSIMGYILQPDELLQTTAPKIIAGLQSESVDVVLLFPT